MSGFGDVLWTTPMLAALKTAYPEASIGYVVRRNSALVLKHNPHVDRLHIFEREDLPYQAVFLRRLSGHRYDLSIDVICSMATAIMSIASHAKDRVGFDFKVRKQFYNHVLSRHEANYGHQVQFYLYALSYLGIDIRDTELVWRVSDDERECADGIMQELGISGHSPLIGLIPTGGYASKKWSPQRYGEVVRELHRSSNAIAVVFWGSEKERLEAEQIRQGNEAFTFVVPKTTLREAAAVMDRCDLVLGNDSGPLHVATALRKPVLGLYGPSRPESQGPWGNKARTVRAPNVMDYCCREVVCTKPDHPCMNNITVEMVASAAEDMLQEYVTP